jgi:hypothetical protein
VTPSPSQLPSPSHPPHQVAPSEVADKSEVSEQRSRTHSRLVATPSTRQDAVGSKLSSQAGGPGRAGQRAGAAGKPSPTSTSSGGDTASRARVTGRSSSRFITRGPPGCGSLFDPSWWEPFARNIPPPGIRVKEAVCSGKLYEALATGESAATPSLLAGCSTAGRLGSFQPPPGAGGSGRKPKVAKSLWKSR